MKRIEEHQEETIKDSESAKEYLNSVLKKKKMYGNLVKQIKSFSIKGEYLELGSGPCVLTSLIADNIPDIHIKAVDISPHMTKIATDYIKNKHLGNKISVITSDPTDEKELKKLGRFNLIYTTYSMHHWKETEKIIHNMYKILNDKGVLIIADLKRIWWLYYLPIQNNWFISSIRASYTLSEVKSILNNLDIDRYKIKNLFPLSRLIIIYK